MATSTKKSSKKAATKTPTKGRATTNGGGNKTGAELAPVGMLEMVAGITEDTPIALRIDRHELEALISENLGPVATINLGDFERIKIPAGGGSRWEVPDITAKGGMAAEETVSGIMIAFDDDKAFWKQSFNETGGGTPPDCSSADTIHGLGDPGYEVPQDEMGFLCAQCPNNQFETAAQGVGKACKDIRLILLLRHDQFLPTLIIAPPGSLQAMKQYNLKLLSQKTRYYQVITNLALEQEVSKASRDGSKKGGIKYSRIHPTVERLLTEEEFQRAKVLNRQYLPTLVRLGQLINREDVEG